MERYREVRKVSRSHHSDVVLVQSTADPLRLFAMKRIIIENDDPSDAVSLNTEVAILARLSHPNIIGYHESFVHGDHLCIVMDYADNGDLLAKVKEARNKGELIPERLIWDWTVQLLHALEFIHGHKIIHRDLKSQNVFLSESGQVKLGDFGIARVMQYSSDLARSNVGTPYYLAPEVCLGGGYDTKADIWSLGCVIYELAMLKHPFEGESLVAVINGIMYQNYEPIGDTYSADLQSLISSMLTKNPEARPSASQLLDQPFLHRLSDELSRRVSRKAYQREISINIPTPSGRKGVKEPSSAPTSALVGSNHGAGERPEQVHSTRSFMFSESLLKQCPNSPNRPLLMCDFLKKKLTVEVFEQIQSLLSTLPEPIRTLKEQPWVFSRICGEENLSIVDVGLAFDAFSTHNKIPYPPTSTSKAGFRKFASDRKQPRDV